MSERLEQLLKFHEQDPTDTFCTYGIALEHAKAGRTADALQWLDRTIELDGAYAYAFFQKARLLAQSDETEAARAAVEQGLQAARRRGDLHAEEELSALREELG